MADHKLSYLPFLAAFLETQVNILVDSVKKYFRGRCSPPSSMPNFCTD